jgi:hypothetical protein
MSTVRECQVVLLQFAVPVYVASTSEWHTAGQGSKAAYTASEAVSVSADTSKQPPHMTRFRLACLSFVKFSFGSACTSTTHVTYTPTDEAANDRAHK